MHEYEVELQFTSGLLGFPDRSYDEKISVDGIEAYFATDRNLNNIMPVTSQVEGSEQSQVCSKANNFFCFFLSEL